MHEIIIAGFGGQGVLVMGQIIATAGMMEQKNVSWFPSYGPEQRGGTCNCSVVISESEVGSPLVSRPSAALVMNLPSLDRFESQVKPEGLLIYNTSLINRKPTREDAKVIPVAANEIADKLGNSRVANMVMLGAFIESTKIVSAKNIRPALESVLPKRHHHLIDLNMQAFERGRAYQ